MNKNNFWEKRQICSLRDRVRVVKHGKLPDCIIITFFSIVQSGKKQHQTEVQRSNKHVDTGRKCQIKQLTRNDTQASEIPERSDGSTSS